MAILPDNVTITISAKLEGDEPLRTWLEQKLADIRIEDAVKLEEQARYWTQALPVIRNIMDEMDEMLEQPRLQYQENGETFATVREWRNRLATVCP